MSVIYYKLQGREIVMLTPEEKWKDGYKIVEQIFCTEIPGGVFVSTVFSCFSARKDNAGNPMLFETMVLGGEHHEYKRMYSSYDDAEKGHQETIEMLFEI